MHREQIGDNVCEDEVNNEICEFDGRDCCKPVGEVNKKNCVQCQCKFEGQSIFLVVVSVLATNLSSKLSVLRASEVMLSLKKLDFLA